jgi:5'-methylthioadenosine phosphorylase
MPQAKIAIIGGTTLTEMEGLTNTETVNPDTPFGKPSAPILTGKLDGTAVAFLPRHGVGHHLLPSEIPARANIFALKQLGVERIIAVCTCGSLKSEIKPGHLVIPNQLIDRTNGRVSTFFGDGIVAHIPFANPFCPDLRDTLYDACREAGAKVHADGVYVCMEGPAFSTRAESRLHGSWGADVIGMTCLPEAKLAREAEICYAPVACVTDYDSWHDDEEPVTIEMIISIMRQNKEVTENSIRAAVGKIGTAKNCECANAMAGAVLTDPAVIPDKRKKELEPLIGKYLP